MNVVIRREDDRLLRGLGRFADDEQSSDYLYVKLVRSPYAHARILGVDVSEAEKLEGVICTLTGAEVAARTSPFMQFSPGQGGQIVDRAMANDVARFQGEPVAAVVAISAMIAEDAAELIKVEYEPLPPVVSATDSLSDSTVLHQESGTNLVWESVYEWGDVDAAFAAAAHTVTIDDLYFHRFSSTPLECYGIVAKWTPGEGCDFIAGVLQPGITMQYIAPVLGLRPDQIRLRSYDVGGAFGIRHSVYVYMVICALLSEKAGGRHVKWIETRREHMIGSTHGADRTFLDTEVALDKDGRILAIRSHHIDDCGAYPRYEPLGAVIWSQVASGNYQISNMRINFQQVCTNKSPSGSNRGYSRMQHIWFLERIIDICGTRLGIDAREMRIRNYVSQMPYTTLNGCVYDSGDYALMLKKASELIGWDQWRARIADMRQEGRIVGIGIGSTLDSGLNNFGQSKIITPYSPFTGNSEAAHVWITAEGTVAVAVGSVSQGQGHQTVIAGVVSDELGISLKQVFVEHGFDSARAAHTPHSGTYASQFAVSTLSAVHGALNMLKRELLTLGEAFMNIAETDVTIGEVDGQPSVISRTDSRSMSFSELWGRLYLHNAGMPDGTDNINLSCRYVFRAPFQEPDRERKYGNLALTYAAQLHIGVIEIDRETHSVRILDYAAVDDCGKVINHAIVRGQVMGAVAHGLGAAMMENLKYDEFGNLLTATFSDYCPITTMNMPTVKYENIQSPSPFTYNGAKGMGEGGGGALHTISSALQDALEGRSITIGRSHYSPSDLWALMQGNSKSPEIALTSR